jgi:hypothetical protein
MATLAAQKIGGNDLGVWISVDDGVHWTRWRANLPTVPVHDLTIHPRENDVVLATYGRALWVGNMLPLRELSTEVLAKPAFVFDVKPAPRYDFGTQGMNFALSGDKYLRVPNEPEGITVNYWLMTNDSARVQITVTDSAGAVARQISLTARRGLNRAVIPFTVGGGRGRGGGGAAPIPGGRGGASATGVGTTIVPGRYTITLEAAGQRLTKPALVRGRVQ